MRFSAKLLGILFAIILVLFVSHKSYAQSTTSLSPNSQYLTSDTNPDVPSNLHTLSQSLLIESVSAMTCQLIGYDIITKSNNCLGIDVKTGKIGYVSNNPGVVGILGQMIAVLYTPPAHLNDYAHYLSSNFGVAKPTYAVANGIGFSSLGPLTSTWIVFRDIAYVLFVLVFVIIGIGIMLRRNIDARTVMTVQNQIPKIIIAIVLVTFSLAIAGLLIDFMWIVTYFAINILTQADPTLFGASPVTNNLMQAAPGFANATVDPSNFLGGIGGLATNAAGSVAATVSNLFNLNPFNNGTSLIDLVSNPIGTLLGAVLSFLITFIVGVVAFFIIVIALIWALFKLWFALLKAYIFILVDVIFAPIWILGGLVPGVQSVGFGPWLRSILGNLMAFPAAVVMFMLAAILADKFKAAQPGVQFVPPLIGNPGEANLLGSLIALGIILATPNVVEMTKKALKAPDINLGPVGQGLGVGAAVFATPFRRTGGALFGKNALGESKIGSAFVGKRIQSFLDNRGVSPKTTQVVRKISQAATGGGFKTEDKK